MRPAGKQRSRTFRGTKRNWLWAVAIAVLVLLFLFARLEFVFKLAHRR
jgi:hypothetical protein